MKRIVLVGKIIRNPEGNSREMSVATDNTIYTDSEKTNFIIIDKRAFIGNNMPLMEYKNSLSS